MAHEEVQRRATPDGAVILCLDCLARRLGRPLLETDFQLAPAALCAKAG
jgi:hypothetical protein